MEKYHRQSIRLSEYDYSKPGIYFITICANDHKNLFGQNINGLIELNRVGYFVKKCWKNIPKHYPNIKLDAFIILPDHIHGILKIVVGAQNFVVAQNFVPLRNEFQKIIPRSIGAIVRGFKIGVTKYCNQKNIFQIWQRNFHDRIVRDESELWSKRRYIQNNPMKHWRQKNTDAK